MKSVIAPKAQTDGGSAFLQDFEIGFIGLNTMNRNGAGIQQIDLICILNR